MLDPSHVLHLCCEKYNQKQNPTEFSEVTPISNFSNVIIPDSLSCCLLKPVSYDVDIFTNNLVPIYEFKNLSDVRKSLISNALEDSYEQNFSQNPLELELNYSAHDFPNDIWNTREAWEISVKTIAVIPLVVIAIFGNLAVIKIIMTKKAMRKNPVNLFIFNMSIADLLCALLFPWIFLVSDFYQRFVLGAFICRTEGFVLVTLMLASVFTLTIISFDRLVAVVLPFRIKRMSPGCARWVIFFTWICACGVSSPLIVWRSYMERHWKNFHEVWCTENIQKLQDYWLVLIVLLVWAPLIILSISYTAIVIKLDTLEKRQRDQPISQIKHKSKVIRMLFLVVLVFSICWIPFTALVFIRNNNSRSTPIEVTHWFRTLYFVSHYLMFLNSAINPIIYGLMNDNFKRELRNEGLSICAKKQKKFKYLPFLEMGESELLTRLRKWRKQGCKKSQKNMESCFQRRHPAYQVSIPLIEGIRHCLI